MSYDPKVWTGDEPELFKDYFVKGPDSEPRVVHFWRGTDGELNSSPFEGTWAQMRADNSGIVRSALPVCSAERHAALEELAEACAHADRDSRMLRSEYLWRSRIAAALAAVENARG